ncbi:MAG: transglycosylase domain-containing protein [Flavobacteriales bacterium]|jgi:penicillin-binding protein 1A|nr:transglycosylase domain-containing protein [Flavobacteriales bacterium]MBK7085515.1 transglycosylase domain-containing protein [Flavobacteriales bacterium]MBK7268183.1 transglycosylase domain-containing protein [Flavobacteriales bacterium]MBK7751162.1 transglycosylase domain-containing protein [Flavobacteriales bacterium]MBK9073503.1 transglycosylase domain-containing protein [Flavobacteriales bacterium]
MSASPAAPRRRPLLWLLWFALLGPLLALALALFIAATGDLPGTSDLENPRSDLATAILFSDGSLMGQYYRENRIPVKYDRISPHVVHALIATEDERFRDHSGIDLRGTLRAAVYLGRKGGASTITQQLAKMLFTEKPASSVQRIFQKLQEWIIAVRLERQYTKEEIIAMYLNRFDWINQAVGIQSAAHVYFNTSPDSLRIEEAALLVGMCKNPALFNPLRRPDTTEHRRMVVLAQMQRAGMIDRERYDSLKALPLGLRFQRIDHTEGPAPYFREVLRAKLTALFNEKDPATGKYRLAKADGGPYDIYTDGLSIHTTVDPRLQAYGEFAVQEHLRSELQKDLFKDLAKKKNKPFDFRVTDAEIQTIMRTAMKRSVRYRVLVGKQCPACERPAQFIEERMHEGTRQHHCRADLGGCDTFWPVVKEKDIPPIFEKPVPMRLFSWRGEIDTVMSPMDSIRYYKSFLQSGLYSIDPRTGFVKAWVGGINFKHFQYDHVEQARRQVGSTFKPFIYATAMREGLAPCFTLPNQKVCFDMPEGQPDWCPENSDAKYGGMITLKQALAGSINTATAWLMKQYGPLPVTVLARHMGVKSPLDPVPSLCLGVADLTLEEMTGAFAAFANQGVHIDPILFTRIEDKNGNAIYDVMPSTTEALDENTAYIMLDMLKGVMDRGTGLRLRGGGGGNRAKYGNIKVPTAGKTGTTQNNSDGWFIGITPDLVTGIWTGAEDRSVRFASTDKGQGANMALPIYGYYMNKVYADSTIPISTEDFERPSGFDASVLDCGKELPILLEESPKWE